MLNGRWDFALDRDARWFEPAEVVWDSSIEVPFSPETEASGIGDLGFYRACWYRRVFPRPTLEGGQRLLVHFGAVDYRASVWVNGRVAGRHEGGYTPFWFDVTDLLSAEEPQTLVVRAEDDPHDLAQPRGKQDWQLEPHSIWYPRTTGIWQSVWLERVPATRIARLRWTPSLEDWDLQLEAGLEGAAAGGMLRLETRLSIGDLILADDSYLMIAGSVSRRIALSDPGVDDYRNELLWSPSRPTLINAELTLRDERGEVVDRVMSYTALRSVGVQSDRFMLNGLPYKLRLVLDQGYWPRTGLTAPDDEALRRDVELAKEMGFNGVRKHQKVEMPRYLYWADRLGLMVWDEMPSAYRFTSQSVDRLIREWTAVIERDLSHPSVVAWVPFNESWGVPDLPAIASQRHYVQAVYHLTHTIDASRPVVGNDGWESVATDMIGVHDYDDDVERLARRYESHEVVGRLFTWERPGGRLLTVAGHPHAGQPILLSEFGGITFAADVGGTWGYSRSESEAELAERYTRLLEVVRDLPLLAGFCYTQFADTYQEANGLLYADRRPKMPLETVRLATRGSRTPAEVNIERDWRRRMAELQRQIHADLPEDDSWSGTGRPATG